MVLQIVLIEDIVHEARRIGNPGGIGLGIGTVERQVELEVRELLLDLVELVQVGASFMARAPYQNETGRFVFSVLNRCMMWLRIGAIPAPPPMKISSCVSGRLSGRKNSP